MVSLWFLWVYLFSSLFYPFCIFLHLFAISHAADSTHPARSTASQASFKCSKHLETFGNLKFSKRSQRVHKCSLNNFAVSHGVVTRRFAEQRVEGAKSLRENQYEKRKVILRMHKRIRRKPGAKHAVTWPKCVHCSCPFIIFHLLFIQVTLFSPSKQHWLW